MATFTTWDAVLEDLQDAIATYAEGAPITKSYTINGKTMVYRSIDEILQAYKMIKELQAIDNAGVGANMTSYGRYSRY